MDHQLRRRIIAEYDQRVDADGFWPAFTWLSSEIAERPDWYTVNGPVITDGKTLGGPAEDTTWTGTAYGVYDVDSN